MSNPAISEQISDEQLLKLYEKHIQHLTSSFQKSYGISREDRQDMAQELRFKLVRIPQEKRDIPMYIKVALNNRARDFWRSLRRKEVELPMSSEMMEKLEESIDFSSATIRPAKTTRDVVDELLDRLSPLQRRLMTAVFGLNGKPPVADLHRLSKTLRRDVSELQSELQEAMDILRAGRPETELRAIFEELVA